MLVITSSDGNEVEIEAVETVDDARRYWKHHDSRQSWSALKLDGVTIWQRPRKGHYAFDGKRYHVSEGSCGWRFLRTGSVYHDSKCLAMLTPNGAVVKASDASKAILKAICVDPLERMAEYGRITGKCGKCGRPLENEESRRIGVGTVCLAKLQS